MVVGAVVAAMTFRSPAGKTGRAKCACTSGIRCGIIGLMDEFVRRIREMESQLAERELQETADATKQSFMRPQMEFRPDPGSRPKEPFWLLELARMLDQRNQEAEFFNAKEEADEMLARRQAETVPPLAGMPMIQDIFRLGH